MFACVILASSKFLPAKKCGLSRSWFVAMVQNNALTKKGDCYIKKEQQNKTNGANESVAQYNNVDYCVCCGAIISEGTMVCIKCINKYK
jgi:hypothetical protein